MQPLSVNLLAACAVVAASLTAAVPAVGADLTARAVRVELDDGSHASGRLGGIDGSSVVVEIEGERRAVPIASVRRIMLESPERQSAEPPVRVMLVDGATIGGEDFAWEGDRAAIVVGGERIELPVDRVRSVAWLQPAGAGNAGNWLGSIPESTDSDIVVVKKGDAFEFVECAIKGVSAERVAVSLDEETIPVKRSKVIGLHWLRPPAEKPVAAVAVDLTSGRLHADRVEWTPDGLVLDGAIRAPAAMLVNIDYAAARMVSLATLEPERLEVEPYFGGLREIAGLAGFFAPRPVAADREFSAPGLLVRPRTVAAWRLPAGSRRFRTVVTAATKGGHAAAVVALSLDDREVFRGDIGGSSSTPIDIDLAGARRLTLLVDFSSPAGGGAVRLAEPTIDK